MKPTIAQLLMEPPGFQTLVAHVQQERDTALKPITCVEAENLP